jgi:Flp pilus assembly protein TadD
MATGEAIAAKNALVEYVRANPQDVGAQLLAAKAALAAGDIMLALETSDAARRQAPDDPEVRFIRAVVLWKRGQFATLAADLYDLIQNNPDDVEAHCLLGEVLRAERKFLAARSHFETALEVNPACAWAKEGLRSLRRAEAEVKPPEERSASLTSATGD